MAVILVLPNSRSEVSGSVRPNDIGSPAQKRSVVYISLNHTLIMLVHGKKVLPCHVMHQVVVGCMYMHGMHSSKSSARLHSLQNLSSQ